MSFNIPSLNNSILLTTNIRGCWSSGSSGGSYYTTIISTDFPSYLTASFITEVGTYPIVAGTNVFTKLITSSISYTYLGQIVPSENYQVVYTVNPYDPNFPKTTISVPLTIDMQTNSGLRNLKGTLNLIVPSCTVTVHNTTVNLGLVKPSELPSVGSTSTPVNFALNLNNCGATTIPNVYFAFQGTTALSGDTTKLDIVNDGALGQASGVAIQMKYGTEQIKFDGTPVLIGTNVVGTKNNTFTAYYVRTGGLKTGRANSQISMVIQYQ